MVKSWGLTSGLLLILENLRLEEASGTIGVVVISADIDRNTKGEGSLLVRA
jgi:hypothetical protein